MSQETTPTILPYIDSAFAFGTNELNAVTLFAYLDGPNKSTDVWREISDLQEGGFFSPVVVSRQRIDDRVSAAKSYGFITPITQEQRPSDPHELTKEGLVVAAISGHIMRDVSIPYNFNVSGIFGTARNISDVVSDNHRVLSPALMRTMLLRGILYARNPIFLKHACAQLGLDESISSHALQHHARHLLTEGFLRVTEKKVKRQHTFPAKVLRLTVNGAILAEKMDDLLVKSFFVDEDKWPIFMSEGLEKAREILDRPEYVTNLLKKRDVASPEKRALAFTDTIDMVRKFGLDGKQFSSGELATFLGNGHTKFAASALAKRLVEAGVLVKIDSHVPKYIKYQLAEQ